MAKSPKTVTLDERVHKELESRPELNFSALVNQLVNNYFTSGETFSKEKAVLEVERERLRDQIQQKEEEIKQLESKVRSIEEQIEERKDEQSEEVQEAVEILQKTSDLTTDNAAVQTQSQKVGVPPERLIELVEESTEEDADAE